MSKEELLRFRRQEVSICQVLKSRDSWHSSNRKPPELADLTESNHNASPPGLSGYQGYRFLFITSDTDLWLS